MATVPVGGATEQLPGETVGCWPAGQAEAWPLGGGLWRDGCGKRQRGFELHSALKRPRKGSPGARVTPYLLGLPGCRDPAGAQALRPKAPMLTPLTS